MNFPLDSSTQTNTALTTTGTSYTYVNTNDLSTKQDLLNASTNLLGIGTNISALNYTNISVNKPTNFQSDWNSTIINKPTNFQSDWNSTIINKPTNFQSDWNSTIINKPDLTVYAIKNNVDSSLNTINSTLATKQNTITAVTPLKKDVSNNISIDLSGYTLLSSFNTLSSTVSTKENALTFTTPLTRTTNTIGIDLSAYPLKTYVDGSLNTINTALGTKQNNLTFSSPLVNTSNTVTIDLSAYDTRSISESKYLKLSGGTMTGALINTSTTASDFKGIYIMHAARQTHIPYIPNGNIYFRAPVIIDNENDYLSFGSRIGDNIIRLYGSDFGFGINSGTLRYNVPMGSVHRFYHGTTNTVWIDDTGRLKATTFEGSGASLNSIPFTALTGTAPYYTKSEIDTSLGNKQNNLTFSNPFSNTSNTIALKYNSAQFNIDSSGNLSLISGTSSQWTTSGTTH